MSPTKRPYVPGYFEEKRVLCAVCGKGSPLFFEVDGRQLCPKCKDASEGSK